MTDSSMCLHLAGHTHLNMKHLHGVVRCQRIATAADDLLDNCLVLKACIPKQGSCQYSNKEALALQLTAIWQFAVKLALCSNVADP